MKRLFARKAFKGFGLDRELIKAALSAARQAGYQYVLLDTLDSMDTPKALYPEIFFEEIEPYYYNPILAPHYLKVDIQ